MLKGKAVYLSSLKHEDIIVINELRNDWNLKRLTLGVRYPVSLESDIHWFEQVSKDVSNKNVYFAIRTLESGNFIGLLQVNSIDWINRTSTVGIQLGKDASGRGFGTDALSIVTSYCINTLNLRKVTASIAAYNRASIKLFEKCGYFLEGSLKQHIYYDNSYADLLFYSYIKDDH